MTNEMKQISLPAMDAAEDPSVLASQLLQNKSIRSLLERTQIPMELVQKKPYTFLRYLKQTEACRGCRSLKECRQPVKGHYRDLIYEGGMLLDALSPCPYQKEKSRAEKHMDQYLVSDLPSHLRAVTFDTLDAGTQDARYMQTALTCMKACSEGQGIYLYGSMGSGKTHLAACACNTRAIAGDKVAFIHYPSFCARMARSVSGNEYEAELRRLEYVRFLVIDDIGAENVTEWNRDSILLPLLNERYEEGLTTWFTSNEDPKSLRQHLMFNNRGKEEEIKAERIMERIRCMSMPVELVGKDRRDADGHATI
ncbi:MAG: ATP-binding protein [Solobacterium sp.]|nr:ATP-binding protein [Solobacterium sp.]